MRPVKPFWGNVEVCGPDDCWPWKAACDQDGYGMSNAKFYASGRAHRAAFIMANGEIPQGMLVCHSCDNPPCVNPNHLFVGTQKDNTEDARAKGRRFTPEQNAIIGASMSKAMLGRPKTVEHRLAISAAHQGKRLSDAHKASISATRQTRIQCVARSFAFGG